MASRLRSRSLLRQAGLTAGPGPALRLREARNKLRLDWIVATMAFLAALAFAGALTMSDQAVHWRTSLSGSLTVEIPAEYGASAADLSAVLTTLRATPGVQRADPLTHDQVGRLLVPWLGASALIETLPVPQLIDVTLSPDAVIDAPALARRLAEAAPGATVDDHGRWVGHLLRLATLASLCALVVVGIVALSAVVAVTITTRAGLALHHEAIDLLHLIGAEDRYIAGEFAREALLLGLRGSLLGVALAIGALYILIALAPTLESVLIPTLAPRPGSVATLALVTVVAGGLCGVTAWATVMNELRKQM
ncbi:MAG: FtsX-like permease family protein [Alphaproteobacteria bacterium]|nr:FtsX-like permease family protein [Alphaproteobacteria bacterium]